jgi:hypothetical protein
MAKRDDKALHLRRLNEHEPGADGGEEHEERLTPLRSVLDNQSVVVTEPP